MFHCLNKFKISHDVGKNWLTFRKLTRKSLSDKLIMNEFAFFCLYLNMIKNKRILLKIKELVKMTEPSATVIIFGSHARGQNNKYSDIDVLILVDNDKITYSDEQRIKYPLYDLEFETGKVISPLVYSRTDWETKHSITPLYHIIKKEGVLI